MELTAHELPHYANQQLDRGEYLRQGGNNEPLRVKYLFNKWLTMEGIRVIINLKELAHFGIWEVGLLASMPIPQKRADLRTWSYQRRSGAKRRA